MDENEEIVTAHGRFRVRVEYDGAAGSPRENANLGVIEVIKTAGYVGISEDYGVRNEAVFYATEHGRDARTLTRYLRDRHGATCALAVRRSGCGDLVVVEDGDQYDGAIYDLPVTRERCGQPDGDMRAALELELKLYNRWAAGEFVGWIAEKFIPACGHGHPDEWVQVCSQWDIDDEAHALDDARRFVRQYNPAVGV